MAVDWEKFTADLGNLVDQAGDRTDRQLANKISSVSRLTDDEVRKLFPDPADVKKLGDLMAIVKQADDENKKINKIVGNIEEFGGVILKLLTKLA